MKRSQAERIQEHAAEVFRQLGIRDLGRIDFRWATTARSTSSRSTRCPRSSRAPASTPRRRWRGCTRTRCWARSSRARSARYGIADARSRARPAAPHRAAQGRLHLQREAGHARSRRRAGRRGRVRLAQDPAGHPRGHRQLRPRGGRPRGDRRTCPMQLASTPVDVVFNIAEGFKGRSRESQVPALLELLDIPYTGSRSRPRSRSRSTRRSPSGWSAPTASSRPTTWSCSTGKERLPKELELPADREAGGGGHLEGRHRQVRRARRGASCARWRARSIGKYRQPALVEELHRPGASSRSACSASGARGCCRPWRSSSSTRPIPRPSTRSR